MRHGRIDHARHGVVPEILLKERALLLAGFGVGENAVAGMSATDAGRLHAARSGQVGRAEAQAVHARAGAADGLDVGHPLRRLEQGMQQNRFADRVLRFEQRDVLIDEMNVPRPSTLGIMITSSLLPTCLMICSRSSSTHGLFKALMRTHIAVSPKS
jgi:hypothetical protein